MIQFRFTIRNPFWKQYKGYQSPIHYITKAKDITKNKVIEVQVSKFHDRYYIFEMDVDLNWNGSDHAGPSLSFSILDYFFEFGMRDRRHWDGKNHKWKE